MQKPQWLKSVFKAVQDKFAEWDRNERISEATRDLSNAVHGFAMEYPKDDMSYAVVGAMGAASFPLKSKVKLSVPEQKAAIERHSASLSALGVSPATIESVISTAKSNPVEPNGWDYM